MSEKTVALGSELNDGLGVVGKALVEATREKRMSRSYYLEQMKEAKEIEKMKAEHARYREALKKIVDFDDGYRDIQTLESIEKIAEQALGDA